MSQFFSFSIRLILMMEIGGNLKAKGKNRLGSKNWKPRAIILWNSHEIWHGFKSQMAGSRVIYQGVLLTGNRNHFLKYIWFLLMSGSYRLGRALNDEFSVECLFWFFQPTQKSDLKVVQITKNYLFWVNAPL